MAPTKLRRLQGTRELYRAKTARSANSEQTGERVEEGSVRWRGNNKVGTRKDLLSTRKEEERLGRDTKLCRSSILAILSRSHQCTLLFYFVQICILLLLTQSPYHLMNFKPIDFIRNSCKEFFTRLCCGRWLPDSRLHRLQFLPRRCTCSPV